MRIAYLVHQDIRGRFGGSEIYARALAEAAAQAGHEVLVIARGRADGRPVLETAENGFRLALLDADYLPAPRARFRLRESYDNPRALKLLVEILQKFSPQHLHVHHFLLTSARLVDWAKQQKIPVTATLHDYWAFCHRFTWQLPDGTPCPGPQGGLRCRRCGKPSYNRWPGLLLQPAHAAGFIKRNALLRLAYNQMNAVFAPSRAVLAAHQVHGFLARNLIHLPYGLPPVEKRPRPEPRSPLVVGYLGRLAPEKGVDTLIEAARLGEGFAVQIFGHGEADYVEKLQQKSKDAPVAFTGPYDHADLDQVLAGVDVVAVPSRWRENLPLVVLEAAARGVPTLVSDLGGLRETTSLCGAQALPPEDPAAWARALADLARQTDHWHRLRNKVKYSHLIEEDLRAHLNAGG